MKFFWEILVVYCYPKIYRGKEFGMPLMAQIVGVE